MPIIKHIPIYAAPKRLPAYVTNEKKTEKTLVTGINCSANSAEAYEDMKFNFERFTSERFFKRSIKSETAKAEKQKIRLHHYIQSFKSGEVTPEEAHRIGVEWAEKVFGKNALVLCATHIDRGHIHNHFAVCPYDLDGRHWNDNMTTLKRCRDVSDKIALAHGLEIIEHPKNEHKSSYGEYKMRKAGQSWKQKLCDDIDALILKDDVRSVDDLARELEAKGYGINRGKYISIKVRKDRKPIRSFRLGDGYSIEQLEYRIRNKNMEMPLSAALKYAGIQREYALCIRQIQIQLYRKPETERLHCATYREIEKSGRLLFYLQDNNIHSVEDFQKSVNSANEKVTELKSEKSEILQRIADEEKIISDIPKYLEIKNRRPLLSRDIKELEKFNFPKDLRVTSLDDIELHKSKIGELKSRLDDMENKIRDTVSEKKYIADLYNTYENQMKSDYQILLEQAKAEMENLRREEERLKAEKENTEISQERDLRNANKSGFSI